MTTKPDIEGLIKELNNEAILYCEERIGISPQYCLYGRAATALRQLSEPVEGEAAEWINILAGIHIHTENEHDAREVKRAAEFIGRQERELSEVQGFAEATANAHEKAEFEYEAIKERAEKAKTTIEQQARQIEAYREKMPDILTEFFQWWWNQDGTNTAAAAAKWWQAERQRIEEMNDD